LDRKDRNPGAFMSYAHADDDDGRISAFRDRLSAQTRKVIGEEFPIFQDCEDIKWGEDWEAQIDESLARVTFFIPIITPSFFRSKYCRDELTGFLEREERLGLKLILPVYYIETALIDDETQRSTDELAQKIASRQYADCRALLIEDLDSQRIRQLIFVLATQIRDILEIESVKTAKFSKDYKSGFYDATVIVGQAIGMGGSLEQLYNALGGKSTPETANIVEYYNEQTNQFNDQVVPYVNGVIDQIFDDNDSRSRNLYLVKLHLIKVNSN
jgi:hypothetical protein